MTKRTIRAADALARRLRATSCRHAFGMPGGGRAFGGAGHEVHERAGLRGALEDAVAAITFTVIAAHIDRGAYDGRI